MGSIAPMPNPIDPSQVIAEYYSRVPDHLSSEHRVKFGTSGHRGSSLLTSFNEWHVAAITQAICNIRQQGNSCGPVFLGMDTHALSRPALDTALEVLAANDVDVMLANGDSYTPTPAISHAIIAYNLGRKAGFADGIILTPSHNPPADGGLKYNPPHGGPAELAVTVAIEEAANKLIQDGLRDVERVSIEEAIRAETTYRHDFIRSYTQDLSKVIDILAIRNAGIHIGVHPLGGAGIPYWHAIADDIGLDITLVDDRIDPTFQHIPADWDGQIRMDPASPYTMQNVISAKDKFDITIACDADHDRHGIVTPDTGLLTANEYLPVAIQFLVKHRSHWCDRAAIGKSIVSSRLINRLVRRLDRQLFEVPVGFKWFAQGLLNQSLCFAGEESGGATFSRFDGSAWTSDKDGILMGLLAAEITAVTGRNIGELYQQLATEHGQAFSQRIDYQTTDAQRRCLSAIVADQIKFDRLAGDKIREIITVAPGNNVSIGGFMMITDNGWFAARPSGTEPMCKIYAESFVDTEHLSKIINEAKDIVSSVDS